MDNFELYYQKWLRGIRQDERYRKEEQRFTSLLDQLRTQRKPFAWDETHTRIQIYPGTPQQLEITIDAAREMEPANLLLWIEHHSIL